MKRNFLTVLNKLRTHSIKINENKTQFLKQEIYCIGHIISENKIKANINEFNSAKLHNNPTTLKQLRSLICFINFYWSHIRKFSTLLAPILDKHDNVAFSGTKIIL